MPRSWSLVWLAGAHREVPDATPVEWRERWAAEAARYGQAPLPATFEDAPNAGVEMDASQAMAEARALETVGVVRRLVVPRLLQVARDRGWWDPLASVSDAGSGGVAPAPGGGRPEIIHPDAATWERLSLAPRVVAPSDPAAGHALIRAAIGDGASVTAAVEGTTVVGLAIAGPLDAHGRRELLALGVAPSFRRQGLGAALLEACVTAGGPAARNTRPTSPSPNATRSNPSIELFAPISLVACSSDAGFRIESADPALRGPDPAALRAVRSTI